MGSTAAGLKAEKDFLKAAGVADGDVILSDGSGLARDDLVTPRAAVALLEYVARQPWGAAFLSTLPVAGVDGTLENRMKNSAAAGLIEAKTGAADHARALSGYATTRGGDYLVFSIFVNNNSQHGADATETLDAIATAMVERWGRACVRSEANENPENCHGIRQRPAETGRRALRRSTRAGSRTREARICGLHRRLWRRDGRGIARGEGSGRRDDWSDRGIF